MGRAGQSGDLGTQGYLLLGHNAIGHSFQNDEAQGILHADQSNGGSVPQLRLTKAPPKHKEMASLDIMSQMPFFVLLPYPYVFLK